MKKLTLLGFLVSLLGFSQTKSTPIISFNSDMKAQFTLDNTNSKVILVLTGSAYNWSSLEIGTSSSTTSGDVYVYTTSVLEANTTPADPFQDWSTVSNSVASGKRTVTLERKLTNSDLNDMQLAFDTTNAIDIVWSRTGTAVATAPNPNRGRTTAIFTTNLGIDDVAFQDENILYPNPTSGEVYINATTHLSKVKVYSQTGTLIKTIPIKDNTNEVKFDVSDLPKALYLFELHNDSEKTWKKVLVN